MSKKVNGFLCVLLMLLAVPLGCKQKGQSSEATSSDAEQTATSWVDWNAEPASDKINLKILYAGHPGSTREKDFLGFLRHYFVAVETCDLASYQGIGDFFQS